MTPENRRRVEQFARKLNSMMSEFDIEVGEFEGQTTMVLGNNFVIDIENIMYPEDDFELAILSWKAK